jgi:hypothetical protein
VWLKLQCEVSGPYLKHDGQYTHAGVLDLVMTDGLQPCFDIASALYYSCTCVAWVLLYIKLPDMQLLPSKCNYGQLTAGLAGGTWADWHATNARMS